MSDKEFVLVSQGIELMRTKSQETAINYVKEQNDDWFDYKQRCIDNYEDYADNYIDLEIEYHSEKDKDKEIERLNKEKNKYKRYYNDSVASFKRLYDINEMLNNKIERLNNIITELEKYLEKERELDFNNKQCIEAILDKLKELKGE